MGSPQGKDEKQLHNWIEKGQRKFKRREMWKKTMKEVGKIIKEVSRKKKE